MDDEPLARSIIREYLAANQTVEVIDECQDGFEALKSIQQHKPDLVFLDIQMPKINGFEMLELIEQPPKVIFTTAFDEFAIKAFEANAVDYLLKPFSRERFEKALSKVSDRKTGEEEHIEATRNLYLQQTQRIVIRDQGKIIVVPLDEISYFEASDDYVKVHAGNNIYLKNKTLSFYERALEGTSFIRVHRSVLLNTDYINRIDPYSRESYSALLTNGEKVMVSKAGYIKLNARF